MPIPDSDYLQADATALAAAIRAGRLTPAEAVAQAFAAIDRVNPQLNAVIPVSYTHLTLPTKRIV